MPKKIKKTEEHLETIEYLLAGVLLKGGSGVKQVAKIIGCSDKTLTKLYPQNKKEKG
ncbi:MAG: hypothetical protein KGH57_00900 [Candidatus Micrarchaeota archaeon]|nr:hypothetical protein [Candidatus Micrarchaeota archaeon]